MIIVLSAIVLIAVAAVALPIGNTLGTTLSQWLEKTFPNVEE